MKYKVKIFDIDYLMNSELTDEDLHLLFDRHSLKYSLIIGAFREAGYELSNDKIISFCKTSDNWMYNSYWSTKQRLSFTNKLKCIYKNVYNYGEQRCLQEAEWWIIMYGLTNIRAKGNSQQYILD